MLIDIKGSTALAERCGDERAHAVIASLFFDIDQPILEHGAEVYSYVGDGLIASWPLADGVRDARCPRCLEAILACLAARAGHYRRAFGVMPEVRIVLHAGPSSPASAAMPSLDRLPRRHPQYRASRRPPRRSGTMS